MPNLSANYLVGLTEINKMKIWKQLFFLILVIIFFLLFFIFFQKPGEIKIVKIAGQDVKVELAITSAEKEKGLSARQGLDENEGMLFVFDKPGEYAFWMKDMNFAIDIVWLDASNQVVHIEKNATPESYPNTFNPGVDAKYVLEVISGFSEKNNLKEGDSVIFTY